LVYLFLLCPCQIPAIGFDVRVLLLLNGLWLSIVCSYFAYSSIITFLQVLLLGKLFGDVESAERSVFLLLCNLAQFVFTFASWYQLEGGQTKYGALFYSMLVLATAGYPKHARIIVGLQIASDLVLIAVFLVHILGKVKGGPPPSSLE